MITIDDARKALNAAVEYSGVQPAEAEGLSIIDAGDYLELCFSTDFLVYDIYVEKGSNEVSGIDTRPIVKTPEMSIAKLTA